MPTETKENLKIAFVVGEFPALTETFILNQITGLLDEGHEVDIITNRPSETATMHRSIDQYGLLQKTYYRFSDIPSAKWKCRLKALVLLCRRLMTNPVTTVRIVFTLLSRPEGFSYPLLYLSFFLLGKKYDIIHCHFGQNAFPFVELLKIGFPLRLLTSFHGFDAHSFVRMEGPRIYEGLFQLGHYFTANTTFTKQRIVQLGCPENRVAVLPESLICEVFLRKEDLPSGKDSIVLLTVGRLVEKKGYEYSLRAVARVYGKYKNIRYWIVGEGPLKPVLEEWVAGLHLEEVVVFMGPKAQEEVKHLYHSADIFILASITAADGDMEGQALVLQEAQTAELPVISTWHNGIPDGVLDGQSGFLVPERDEVALAESIEWLIEHPDERKKMGRCGKEFVIRKYDSRIVNQQLLQIYRNLLISKPSPIYPWVAT
jgi:colanic acid/amylovoran biosynthesis glycosyltransferase